MPWSPPLPKRRRFSFIELLDRFLVFTIVASLVVLLVWAVIIEVGREPAPVRPQDLRDSGGWSVHCDQGGCFSPADYQDYDDPPFDPIQGP